MNKTWIKTHVVKNEHGIVISDVMLIVNLYYTEVGFKSNTGETKEDIEEYGLLVEEI